MRIKSKGNNLRPHLWLIRLIGVIVPRRLRADWRQEWEAELRYRERLLAEWDRLDWRNKFDLLRRSLSAFWDALWLQPQRWEDEMVQDLRYGVRMLLKNPGFTLVVALSLALGIGANTVVFSLLDAVLLKTLPVSQPEQLVLFRWLSGENNLGISTSEEGGSERDKASGLRAGTVFSYPAFEHFRANNQSLSETFAFVRSVVSINVDGQMESVPIQLVSGNYFAGLGLPALMGRTLTNEDDKASAEPVVIISHQYWQRRFAGDPQALGKTITFKNRTFTIAGVTPPEFYGTSNIGKPTDIWAPLALMPKDWSQNVYPMNKPRDWWLNIMGRLKPGVSMQQAHSELDLAMRQHVAELQKTIQDQLEAPKFDLVSGSQGLMQARQKFSEPLRVLMIIVGLVLAVACLNIANLLLSRAAMRRKEIAVRLAAGASRLRIVRQLLTESLLLALLGGTLGIAFAYWGKDILMALHPLERTATLPDLKLDLRVLGFTAAVTALTGILFGLAPALRATRVDLFSALKEGAAQTGYSRLRLNKGLIITQVAISLVLLVGSGLFVRTLQNLTWLDLGFNRENLMRFNVSPVTLDYKGERLAYLYQQLLERIETTPGVRSATASRSLAYFGRGMSSFCVPGYTPQPDENMVINRLFVAANFFESMEMPILQGRGLTRRDIESSINEYAIRSSEIATLHISGGKTPKEFAAPRQVAVVNQAMAQRYLPNVDPIGRRISFFGKCKEPEIEIVGVVRDAKYEGLRKEILPVAYLPYVNSSGAPPMIGFLVRTMGDPEEMTPAIQNAVQSIEPRLQLLAVKTMQAEISELVTQERLFASLSSFFGLLALILVAIGLYGVMSYTVARRTHEIGIRMALGAQRGDVLRLVMRETLCLALAGVALGIPAALLATRWIESQLFGLAPHDPLTITLVTLLLVAAMALAGYLPARKAAHVDPLIALRCE